MKKFFNALLTGFALFFSIPTLLILASWNALPGTSLYPVKSSLEDVALALTGNTRLARSFSVSFTERRYDEAVKLLAKEGSTVGYELLVAEAKQTRNLVIEGQDVKSGAELKSKITKYQTEIATKKAQVQTQVTSPSYVPSTPKPTPVPTTQEVTREVKTVVVVKPVEIVIEEEEPEEVLENLEVVEKELEEILEDLEEELPETNNVPEMTEEPVSATPNPAGNIPGSYPDKDRDKEEDSNNLHWSPEEYEIMGEN